MDEEQLPDYDSLTKDYVNQNEAPLRQSMFTASETSPDDHAKVLHIANQAGLNPELVAKDPTSVEKQNVVDGVDYDSLVKDNIRSAKFLSNGSNATLAQDDIENVKAHEDLFKNFDLADTLGDTIHKGFNIALSNIAKIPQGALDIATLPAHILSDVNSITGGMLPAYRYVPNAKVEDYLSGDTKQAYQNWYQDSLQENKQFEPGAINQNIYSGNAYKKAMAGDFKGAGEATAFYLVEQAPVLASMIVAPLFGMISMFSGMEVDAKERSLESGIGSSASTANAILQASAMTFLHSDAALPALAGIRNSLIENVGKEGAREIAQHTLSTMARSVGISALDFSAGTTAMKMSDFISGADPHAFDNFSETLGQSLVEGTVLGGATTAVHYATAARNLEQSRIEAKADQYAETYAELGKLANESKVHERWQQAHNDLVRDTSSDDPNSPKFAYITLDKFNEVFENPAETAHKMNIGELYDQAQEQGTDIKVPLADWVTNLAKSPEYNSFKDDVKFDNGPDDHTVNEAKTRKKELKEKMKAEAELAKGPTEELNSRLKDEITKTGYTSGIADIFSKHLSNGIEGMGKLFGMDVSGVQDALNLSIKHANEPKPAEVTKGVEVFRQGEDLNNPIENPLSDEAKNDVAKNLTPDTIKHETFLDSLAKEELAIHREIERQANESSNRYFPSGLTDTLNGNLKDGGSSKRNEPKYVTVVDESGRRITIRINPVTGVSDAQAIRSRDTGIQRGAQETSSRPSIGETSSGISGLFDRIRSGFERRALDSPVDKPKGETFFQAGDIDSRGQLTVQGRHALMELFKTRDFGTIVHEAGHYFLEVLDVLSNQEGATDQGKRLAADTLKWLGRDSFKDITTADHEKFADAHIAYMMEGKSPTPGMRRVFSKFKTWLTKLYEGHLETGLPTLDPQIRDIFDRIHSGQEVADRVMEDNHKISMVPDPVAQMGEKKGMEYIDAVLTAKSETEDNFTSVLLEKYRAENIKKYTEEKSVIRDQVTKQVEEIPVYKAIDQLQAENPEGTELKLKTSEIPEEYRGKLPKGVESEEAGLHPDIIANTLGYDTGEELLKAMSEAKPKEEFIYDETEKRMEAENPDIIKSSKELRAKAEEAFHNEGTAKKLMMEMEWLWENAKSTVKEGIRNVSRRPPTQEELNSSAFETVNESKAGDLDPQKHLRAEEKASKEAGKLLAKGDFEGAVEAKQREALNHALYKESMKQKDFINKEIGKLKRFTKESIRSKIDLPFREQIDALLDRFSFAKNPTTEAKTADLMQFVEDLAGTGRLSKVDQRLLNELNKTHYKEMTVDEIKGLFDSINSIESIGRKEREITLDGQKQELQAMVSEAVGTMLSIKQRPLETDLGLDKIEKTFLSLKSKGRQMDASLLKMERLFHWLDARNPNGVFNKVFRRISDAGVKENDMMKEVSDKLNKLNEETKDDFTKDGNKTYESDTLTDIKTGKKLKVKIKELLSIAGNMLNESSAKKMAKAHGWNEADIWDFLHANMRKGHWDLIQGVSDTFEPLWKEKLAMNRRLGIDNPDKIEPRAFMTPFGEYRGGYYPEIYDPAASQDVRTRNLKADHLFDDLYLRANTDTGSMNTRVEGYARPILLSIDVIPSKIKDEIHDIAYREALVDAHKLLTNKEISSGITRSMGQEYYDQVMPWLQSIANDRKVDMKALENYDKLAREARTRTTMVGLGWRVTTMYIHGTGAAAISAVELGHPKWILSGVEAFIGTPTKIQANIDFILERSGEMRHRGNEGDRDSREAFNDIELKLMNPALSQIARGWLKAQQSAFRGVNTIDMASAWPTWMGAYNKAMATEAEGGLNMSEKEAAYFADKSVRNAHGGTGVKDLARVQRGPEIFKLTTMFYSFYNTLYSNIRDKGRVTVNSKNPVEIAKATTTLLALTLGMNAMHHFYSGRKKDEDKNESWLKWFAKGMVGSVASTIPWARDFSSHYIEGKDYAMSPVGQLVSSVDKNIKDIKGVYSGEGPTKHWLKNTITTAGYALKGPLGQPATTAQFLWDVKHHQENPHGVREWLRGMVTGHSKEQ